MARAGGIALYAALGVAAALLAALALPLAFGARPLVVLSGSMEPTLAAGDVVVVKRITLDEASIGDVVTFRSPAGELLTHRVRGIRARGAKLELITQGDANNAPERWTMARGKPLARAVYRIPLAGRLILPSGPPLARLALFMLPLLLLCGWEIWRIWRPRAAPA